MDPTAAPSCRLGTSKAILSAVDFWDEMGVLDEVGDTQTVVDSGDQGCSSWKFRHMLSLSLRQLTSRL